MSKGNVLLGMSRGKLGDLVLTRGAGEQIARARNRHPKNPQTTKQMAQRAALATLVEFFVRGRKNLFKFAFESKKPGESDYNAFVRANMGIVPVQSSKTLKENGPVFGEFILSQGSLTQPSFEYGIEYPDLTILFNEVATSADKLTIGEFSKAFAETNGLLDGDIITIVAVLNGEANPANEYEQAVEYKALTKDITPSKWIIKQFTLEFASKKLVSTLGIFDTSDTSEGVSGFNVLHSLIPADADDPTIVSAAAVIASRVTPSGVKVSTSTMKLSNGASAAAAVGRTDAWKEWVAKNWVEASSLDVAPEDILKGSLSVN